jgi:outer membrane protein OmpA-like peptidoglycan-associated protein
MRHKTFATILMLILAVQTTKGEEVIQVHLDDKVPLGKKPSLVISVRQSIKQIKIKLTRSDGKNIELLEKNIPRDSKRTFYIPQKKGSYRYNGTLTVTFFGGEEGIMNLGFEATVVSSLSLSASRQDLDLENNSLILKSQQLLKKIDYQITSEEGSIIAKGTQTVDPPSSTAKVEWKQTTGKVLKINLVAHNTDDIYEDFEMIPWNYYIPHEEIIFDTGKWDIKESELPKLDHSYQILLEGLRRYQKLLDVKLYIAGYTDTVAPADSNLILSQKRAKAIAKYFKNKGFTQPIYYQGFGERGLKVPTSDEVDEPQNRRAEYVLAAEPPAMDIAGAYQNWKRLQ